MIWSEVFGGIAVILYLAIGFGMGLYVAKRNLLEQEGLSKERSDRWVEYFGTFFTVVMFTLLWPVLGLAVALGAGIVKIMKIK